MVWVSDFEESTQKVEIYDSQQEVNRDIEKLEGIAKIVSISVAENVNRYSDSKTIIVVWERVDL